MLKWFARRARAGPPSPPRTVPPDHVVWAVGDIHGRADLLTPLLSAMIEDLSQSPKPRKVLVFLGDYIDRGAQSRQVLDMLCALDGQVEAHFLRGNHEERMEAVLSDPQLAPGWCEYGGRETMRAYGAQPPTQRGDEEGWKAAVEQLNAALPVAHRDFLARQAFCVSIGDYFFAHAGARPGTPLNEQTPHDLMWIRHEFLEDSRPFEQVVVHGHTPSQTVWSDNRRIGLDTGAYATGVLSALRLEGSERGLLQTAVSGGRVGLNSVVLDVG